MWKQFSVTQFLSKLMLKTRSLKILFSLVIKTNLITISVSPYCCLFQQFWNVLICIFSYDMLTLIIHDWRTTTPKVLTKKELWILWSFSIFEINMVNSGFVSISHSKNMWLRFNQWIQICSLLCIHWFNILSRANLLSDFITILDYELK